MSLGTQKVWIQAWSPVSWEPSHSYERLDPRRWITEVPARGRTIPTIATKLRCFPCGHSIPGLVGLAGRRWTRIAPFCQEWADMAWALESLSVCLRPESVALMTCRRAVNERACCWAEGVVWRMIAVCSRRLEMFSSY